MKKYLLTLFILCCALVPFAQAQQVPQGMKYQAVARSLSGEVLANQPVTLKISLNSNGSGLTKTHYSETHTVTTNALGLFDLTIGSGKAGNGTFKGVPWSSEDIWMEIAIQDGGKSGFSTISSSRLLAVPYAFHAMTANELVSNPNARAAAGPSDGVPSNVWSTQGNTRTNPTTDRMGTMDYVDLIFVTNAIERLRITKDGDIILKNNLFIQNNLTVGNNLTVVKSGEFGEDLTVKRNVNLNTVSGSTTVNGPTTLKNTLDVDGITKLKNNTGSTSPTTGALVVTGGVGIGQNLNVGGTANFGGATSFGGKLLVTDGTESTNTTTGAAVVTGGVGIGKNLNVGGATNLTNSLNVGGATTLTNSLNVSGATTLTNNLTIGGITAINNNLNVVDDDAGYVATITNTNTGDGDGLQIKLGKTHPAWNGTNYREADPIGDLGFTPAVNQVRSWINGQEFNATQLLNLFPSNIVAQGACSLTNLIVDQINAGLNLPVKVPALSTPAITIFGGIEAIGIPALVVPALNVTPEFTLIPKIPAVPCVGLPAYSFASYNFNDVANTLNSKNEFLSFVDQSNRSLGAVRAQSLSDLKAVFTSTNYLFGVLAKVAGLDPVRVLSGVATTVQSITNEYNHLGVEYASGHGDYAEWLERSEPGESISEGDIVGVRGGRISKNLQDAEQILAVSTRPIVLGNNPPAGRAHLGNKIAFMGQIPVKVMGPVNTGDYIVAKSKLAGYGVAVHPAWMTTDDFRLAVGRSWEENTNDGAKMINTIVGVHNGDYVRLLKQSNERVEQVEARLSAMEEKVNRIYRPFSPQNRALTRNKVK